LFKRGTKEYLGIKTDGNIYTYSDEGVYKDKVLWTTNSHRYLVLNYENRQRNAWSISDSIPPYVDINYDYVYYRTYTDANLVPYEMHSEYKVDVMDFNLLVDRPVAKFHDPYAPAILDEPNVSTTAMWDFKAQRAFNEVDLFSWDKNNSNLHLALKKITCALNNTGTLTQPYTRRIKVGHQAVRVAYSAVYVGPGLLLQYSLNDGAWTDMPDVLHLASSTAIASDRLLQFRFAFTSGIAFTPSLSQFIINISLGG
jgi:hypothetical protein